MADLAGLLARVKAATGPDREIDDLIAVRVAGMKPTTTYGHEILGNVREAPNHSPRYTASLDAALALVERVLPGWSIQLSQNPNNIGNHARICGEHLRDEPVGFFHGSKPLPITILIALLAALATQDSVGDSKLTERT